jgi:hypothetical protein
VTDAVGACLYSSAALRRPMTYRIVERGEHNADDLRRSSAFHYRVSMLIQESEVLGISESPERAAELLFDTVCAQVSDAELSLRRAYERKLACGELLETIKKGDN